MTRWPAGVPIVRNKCCVFAVVEILKRSQWGTAYGNYRITVQWLHCFDGGGPFASVYPRMETDLIGVNPAGRIALEIARGK